MRNKLNYNESVVSAIVAATIFMIVAILSFFIGKYVGIARIDHDIPESIGFIFSLGFGFLSMLSGVVAIAFAMYHRDNNPRNSAN